MMELQILRWMLYTAELPSGGLLQVRRALTSTLVAFLIGCLGTTDGLLGQDRREVRGASFRAPEKIAEALGPFRNEADSAEVARLLEESKVENGFPATMLDHVLVARLWRRAGVTNLALAALAAPGANVDRNNNPLALLERARVLLELDVDRQAGARAYRAACVSMDRQTHEEIGRDLLAVATPTERDEWSSLPLGKSACEWLDRFWEKRAQLMATPADERLALHYRRLAHAREWYWIARPRFQVSTAHYHGRPDSLGLDDRGLIYVRMGPALRNEGFNAEGAGEPLAGASSVEGAGEGRHECWPYWRSDGYHIFCFAADVDNDYRLLSGLLGVHPGTSFFQRYVVNSNLPRNYIRDAVVHAGPGLGDDSEWQMNAVEKRGAARQAQLRIRENIDQALREAPDVPDIRASVRLRVETLRFLNPSDGQWQVWTLTTVRAGDLTPVPGPRGDKKLAVSGRYSTFGPDGVQIREIGAVTVAAGEIDDHSGIPMRAVLTAPPGPLPLTVVIEDLNAPGTGGWHQDTVNVPAIGGLPQLSDIAVAQAEGGTWTRDGRTFLQVSPAHVTNPDGSIHTYFEVYGVRPGTRYDVEFRLAPVEAAERIWRLEPDDLGFRLQFTSEMPGEIGRHHLRLDLGDTEPGEYVLAVRIQDEDTKAYSLPSVTEVFVAGR